MGSRPLDAHFRTLWIKSFEKQEKNYFLHNTSLIETTHYAAY
jgi:hypothetical protein